LQKDWVSIRHSNFRPEEALLRSVAKSSLLKIARLLRSLAARGIANPFILEALNLVKIVVGLEPNERCVEVLDDLGSTFLLTAFSVVPRMQSVGLGSIRPSPLSDSLGALLSRVFLVHEPDWAGKYSVV
jgi:hypothetical protein